MTQARIMSIGLQRRIANLKSVLADLPVDQQVEAWMKVVRRNEKKDHGWPRALAAAARRQVTWRLAPLGVGVYGLTQQLTDEERIAAGRDVEKYAFDKWLQAHLHQQQQKGDGDVS